MLSTVDSQQLDDSAERKITVPKYPRGCTILERIGNGGMAVVFRAIQQSTGRECAIKYVDRYLNPIAVDRLEREVRAIAAVDHPNVVKIIECNLLDSIPNFVMEYAGGGTLSERIERSKGGVPIDEAVEITETIARVMAIAHDKKLIHRDLKPGNILLDADGEIKIADFGLARNLDTDPSITRSGAIIGTPCFMSPEQAAGKPATQASDIYGTGAILYNLLTGQPPHRQRDQIRTVEAVIRDHPVSPRTIRGEIPRDLEAICLKALEKAPADRYQSECELADDLSRFRKKLRTRARPRPLSARLWSEIRKHRQWLGTAAVVILAIILANVVRPERPRKRLMTQEELTEKIRTGKPVTVINERELLVEPYWMFESAELKRPAGIDEFSMLSSDSAGLGVVRNPGVNSYRVRCEMRLHQLASGLKPAAKMRSTFDHFGLMFANRDWNLGPATAHFSTCISLTELCSDHQCANRVDRNQFSVCQMAFVTQPLEPGQLFLREMGNLPIDPPADKHPEWRKIIVDIDEKWISIRQGDQVRTIFREQLLDERIRLREQVFKTFGMTPVEHRILSPQQEIGLWVSDSWSGIRNFEIQALPSQKMK